VSSNKKNGGYSNIVTILVSQHKLQKKWLDRALESLPKKLRVQVFFVGSGTLLVGENLPKYKFHNLVYCAYSHREFNGPKPIDGMKSGGLLDLGEMISQSQYTISLPKTILPIKPAGSRLKEIGVVLDPDSQLEIEGLRVATGLAGCNHRVMLFFPVDGFPFIADGPQVPQEAKPYLETLSSLGGRFSAPPVSYDDAECDILISV
jgi:hypothetical protein